MFHPGGSDRKLSNARMLAEMIALLGVPSRQFLQRADETLAYWHHDGGSLTDFRTTVWTVSNYVCQANGKELQTSQRML